VFERVRRTYQVKDHVQIDRMQEAFLEPHQRYQLTIRYEDGKHEVLQRSDNFTTTFPRQLG